MATEKIPAETRTEFGKGAARRIRRAHKIPAVLYGHGTDPVHVALPGHATMLALKHSNTLLTLDLGDGATQLALPKDVQRNPVRGEIEHVDLVLVRRGEKVTVEVTVHLTGEAASGTLVTQDLSTIELEADALNIPESIEFSVEGIEAGTQISAGSLTLPEGSELKTNPEALVAMINAAPTESEMEAEVDTEGAGVVEEPPSTEAADSDEG